MKKMSGVKCSLVIIVICLLCLLIAYFFTNETTAELLSCLKVIVFKYEFESIVLLTIVLILAVILFLIGYVFGSKFNKTETKNTQGESTTQQTSHASKTTQQKKQTSYASHASKTNQTKNNSTGRP